MGVYCLHKYYWLLALLSTFFVFNCVVKHLEAEETGSDATLLAQAVDGDKGAQSQGD